MKFILSVVALAGVVLAQDPVPGFDPIQAPTKASSLKAGDSFTIKWEAAPADTANEPVDIILLGGADPQHLAALGDPIVG
jgi:hypothetical protein